MVGKQLWFSLHTVEERALHRLSTNRDICFEVKITIGFSV
jgi:hypothetical protein